MGIPILSVRDDQGNLIPIPAIQGEAGPPGQKGDTGPAGAKGDKGDTGDPGPNLINQNTLTPLAGILMGAGGNVKTAVSGTDYAAPAEVAAKLDADDYTRTINTATTTGTASNYILTLDPAPDALVQGMMLLVNFHAGSDSTTTPPLLNVNGLGGKYLMPAKVGSARPFAAGLHVIFYDGTNWRMLDNAFLSVSGGTVYGNIVPDGALSYDLGASGVPWYHIYANNGNFSNTLAVGGKSVWHRGNTGVQRVPLQPSISHGANQSFYIKDPVSNIVHVNIAASGMPITAENVIATLPAGFRPGQIVYCGTTSEGDTALYGYVSENGEIKAKNMILSAKPQAWTFLQFTFVAEN